MINSFFGKYRFLSNFYPSVVMLDGEDYPTVENAYQASKTLSAQERKIFERIKPGEAKLLGKQLNLRSDWEDVKIAIMKGLVSRKFEDRQLAEMLLATGDEELIEGNYWNDTFWGVCRGVGENHLGKILMQAREEIRSA